MFRKLSIPGRRSSPPKRLSSLKFDLDEKNSKAPGDGKRSLIPRFTVQPSVEGEEVRRSSARLTSGSSRSKSVERGFEDNVGRPSDFRARSVENLCTPKYSAKNPATSSSRTAPGSRTVRKDNRPLNDRGFQNVQLTNVQTFLVKENIISETEVHEVRSPMTLKLFVTIMNRMLTKLFPTHSVTLSNYCEIIPYLMKKLKYPGNVTRSLLITANTTHSWPYVLGMMSWLADALRCQSDLEFIDDDPEGDGMVIMNSDKVNKFLEDIRRAYIEWSENLEDSSISADEQFCDELLWDVAKPLKEELIEVKKEVEALQSLLSEIDNSEELAAEQQFTALKGLLVKKKSNINSLQERVLHDQEILRNREKEEQTQKQTNENLKQRLDDNPCINVCDPNECAELQIQLNSLKNIIKLQDGHLEDISNKCYADDLANARLQGKVDEARLKREALIRECTSQYVEKSELNLALKYTDDDISDMLIQFFENMKKKNESLENKTKECDDEKKNVKLQISEAEEKLRECIEKENKCMLESFILKLKEIKKLSKSLMNKLNHEKEDNIAKKSMLDEKEKNLEKVKADSLNLGKELTLMNEIFEEKQVNYLRILKQIGDMYIELVKKCKEEVRSFNSG